MAWPEPMKGVAILGKSQGSNNLDKAIETMG